jgi:cell division protein FtsB
MASPQSRKPQRNQRSRTSPKRVLAAAVALGVAVMLLASVVGLAEKYITIRKRVRDLKEEQQRLVAKQEMLVKTNAYIETNEGEERELREKYNVVKPGEGMIVITNPATVGADTGPTTRVGRWWDALLRGLGIRGE